MCPAAAAVLGDVLVPVDGRIIDALQVADVV